MAGQPTSEWRDRRKMHDELITEASEVASGWF
jgi:hypothetical protein